MTDRRDFLSTATLATAATALPAAAVAGEFTGKIKKGVKFTMVNAPDLSIDETSMLFIRNVGPIGFPGEGIAATF